jgi:glycosyltransferase involved in cell wall biosynthesis
VRLLTFSNCPTDDALGSGYVVRRYAAGLRLRGHEVEVRGPADYEPLHRVTRRAIRYRQALGMAVRSVLGLVRSDHDVVEFYGGEAWLALVLLARWPGRRFLLVSHSNGIEPHCEEVLRGVSGETGDARDASDRWYHLRLGGLAALGLRHADAIVTVADYDRDYALREGYLPPSRVLAIENPLPDSYLGLPYEGGRGPVLGFCGSWIARKGTALLERDIPRILRELPEWRFRLVGVGAGFRAAEHFPADVLARIEVVAQADRETELRDLYRSFSILVQPSLYESFGLTVAEGMACGCALVTTPVGFAAGLRHGEEAELLSTPTASLYKAVLALAGDAARRERIARGGHRRVQGLRWEPAVATIEAAYTTWLAALRGGGGGDGGAA